MIDEPTHPARLHQLAGGLERAKVPEGLKIDQHAAGYKIIPPAFFLQIRGLYIIRIFVIRPRHHLTLQRQRD